VQLHGHAGDTCLSECAEKIDDCRLLCHISCMKLTNKSEYALLALIYLAVMPTGD
jgi:hypothetical protein